MIRNNLRQVASIRRLHNTAPVQSFLGDWFSKKKSQDGDVPPISKVPKQKKDLVKDQNKFEVDPNSKIVFKTKKNSPNTTPFSVSTHMPDFEIHQWKDKSISFKEANEIYTSEKLLEIINDTLSSLGHRTVTLDTLETTSFEDLTFRFVFSKELQKKLGIDIKDSILTKSHDLSILFEEVNNIITARFKNERNPNDINLQQSDFTAPNVFVNTEKSEFEQAKEFERLVEQARSNL